MPPLSAISAPRKKLFGRRYRDETDRAVFHFNLEKFACNTRDVHVLLAPHLSDRATRNICILVNRRILGQKKELVERLDFWRPGGIGRSRRRWSSGRGCGRRRH